MAKKSVGNRTSMMTLAISKATEALPSPDNSTFRSLVSPRGEDRRKIKTPSTTERRARKQSMRAQEILIRENPIALAVLLQLDLPLSFYNHLAAIFAQHQESIRLAFFCISNEINDTDEATLIFRGTAKHTKILSGLINTLGRAYLKDTLSYAFSHFIQTDRGYDIDPLDVPAEQLRDNIANMLELTKLMIQHLEFSLSRMPPIIVLILRELHDQTQAKFPGCETNAVVGLFMLRFFMPAITMPEEYLGKDAPGDIKKICLSLGKILQFTYNQAEVKEEGMLPFSEFIRTHRCASTVLTTRVLQLAQEYDRQRLTLVKNVVSKDAKRAARKELHTQFTINWENFQNIFVQLVNNSDQRAHISQIFTFVRREKALFYQSCSVDFNFWRDNLISWMKQSTYELLPATTSMLESL